MSQETDCPISTMLSAAIREGRADKRVALVEKFVKSHMKPFQALKLRLKHQIRMTKLLRERHGPIGLGRTSKSLGKAEPSELNQGLFRQISAY